MCTGISNVARIQAGIPAIWLACAKTRLLTQHNQKCSIVTRPLSWREDDTISMEYSTMSMKKFFTVPIPNTPLLPTYISLLLVRHWNESLIPEHLQSNHPLCICQWGFVESWPVNSTVTALLYHTSEWLKSLENGNEVCAIFSYIDKHLTKLVWTHTWSTGRTKWYSKMSSTNRLTLEHSDWWTGHLHSYMKKRPDVGMATTLYTKKQSVMLRTRLQHIILYYDRQYQGSSR